MVCQQQVSDIYRFGCWVIQRDMQHNLQPPYGHSQSPNVDVNGCCFPNHVRDNEKGRAFRILQGDVISIDFGTGYQCGGIFSLRIHKEGSPTPHRGQPHLLLEVLLTSYFQIAQFVGRQQAPACHGFRVRSNWQSVNCKCRKTTNKSSTVTHGTVQFQIFKNEGPSYIFRGMVACQQREILGYGAQFYTYDKLKDLLVRVQDKEEPSHIDLLVSGGFAGVACWTVGYPQDTLKTILQCESGTTNRRFRPRWFDGGMLECAKHVIKGEGITGLWKGFSVCLFRAFYANAIGFYSYETSKSFITTYF